jgi:hypothetical protein
MQLERAEPPAAINRNYEAWKYSSSRHRALDCRQYTDASWKRPREDSKDMSKLHPTMFAPSHSLPVPKRHAGRAQAIPRIEESVPDILSTKTTADWTLHSHYHRHRYTLRPSRRLVNACKRTERCSGIHLKGNHSFCGFESVTARLRISE